LVILGWDSATFDVVDPMLAAGRLPALAALCERGFRAPLRSTWPPMTDCAWTSAFTGRNPGGHGIFGSWYRAPGDYSCRYFSSRDRRAPALWELADGARFAVFNVPMTFPPTAIDGVMVSGYGAPPGARFCSPDGVQDELARRWPLGDLLDRAPHSTLEAFLDDLIRGLERQAEALVWLAGESGADCLVAVWPHVDRAQHFFWRFRGTEHRLSDAVELVYEAMDRATGAVVEAFDDADFLVVSDHGAGTLKGDVNVGAWLASKGYAAYGPRRRAALVELAWKMPPSVRRLGRRLWPGGARRAFGATLAGQLGSFSWADTTAFVGFHSDLWLNLAGREPAGRVAPAEADRILDDIAAGLLALDDPATGERLFAAAHRRDEIFSGPAVDLAPDIMLDPWSAGYRVAPGREPSDGVVIRPVPLAGVDEAWSADHRPLGIFVAAGPRIASGECDELSLYDVCPTALALLGREVPEGLDGRPAEETLAEEFVAAHPVRRGASAGERATGGAYSEDEAAAVAAHLKDLGYIE
jgi:predicted AlkP superfamily phosphohydrolase/phosphomutase